MSCLRAVFLCSLFFALGLLVETGSLDGLVVVIVSQSNSFHASRVESNIQQMKKDLQALHVEDFSVITSLQLEVSGWSWTIVPLLKPLAAYEAKWYLFLAEQTQVNFTVLESALSGFDSSSELFLGHGLSDKEHVITHHYAPPHSLLYPHFPSGFLLSQPALLRASKNMHNFKGSFNIDVQFELAMFLKFHRLTKEEIGPTPPPPPTSSILLTNLPALCMAPPPFPADGSCATVHEERIPECGGINKVTTNQVHFAVKTCSKFHDSRLPVVHKTWARDVEAASITYYSDQEDGRYSTVYSGIPNTEKGHCGKTVAIIRRFHSLSKSKSLKWLVIADDDTLLSVPRLLRLLRCYDHSQAVLLGEAYGYEAHISRGYTYITGGGGMVLSLQAVISFMKSGLDCHAPDSPDDMFLGSVAERLDWDIVHSPLFHQSQPPSFPAEVLQLQESISFHRHSPLDPLQVYASYLQDHNHQPNKKESSKKTHLDHKSNAADTKTEL